MHPSVADPGAVLGVFLARPDDEANFKIELDYRNRAWFVVAVDTGWEALR